MRIPLSELAFNAKVPFSRGSERTGTFPRKLTLTYQFGKRHQKVKPILRSHLDLIYENSHFSFDFLSVYSTWVVWEARDLTQLPAAEFVRIRAKP